MLCKRPALCVNVGEGCNARLTSLLMSRSVAFAASQLSALRDGNHSGSSAMPWHVCVTSLVTELRGGGGVAGSSAMSPTPRLSRAVKTAPSGTGGIGRREQVGWERGDGVQGQVFNPKALQSYGDCTNGTSGTGGIGGMSGTGLGKQVRRGWVAGSRAKCSTPRLPRAFRTAPVDEWDKWDVGQAQEAAEMLNYINAHQTLSRSIFCRLFAMHLKCACPVCKPTCGLAQLQHGVGSS